MTWTPGGSTHPLRRALVALLLVALPAAPAALSPAVALAETGYSAAADAASQPDGPGAAPDVAGTLVGAPAAAPAVPDPAVTETPLEASLLTLLNADRAASGLAALEFDPALLSTARQRAGDQIAQPALNHWDTQGQLVFVKLLAAAGVDYQLAGENLARLNGPDSVTASRAEDALMHSPTHRANILEPTFNRVAIGAAVDGNGRVIFAQIFRNKVS